ncbi:MAG: outer membrane beta-barrel protein [Gammaproteobacteria bacterium]
MKLKLIVALIATAGFGAAQAQAQSYVGVNLGRAEHKLAGGPYELTDSDLSAKVYGGWQFNPTFGIEGGYNRLGKGDIGGNVGNLWERVQNVYVAATATLPVNEDFSLFAKAGAARNRVNLSGSGHEDRTSALIGIGAHNMPSMQRSRPWPSTSISARSTRTTSAPPSRPTRCRMACASSSDFGTHPQKPATCRFFFANARSEIARYYHLEYR